MDKDETSKLTQSRQPSHTHAYTHKMQPNAQLKEDETLEKLTKSLIEELDELPQLNRDYIKIGNDETPTLMIQLRQPLFNITHKNTHTHTNVTNQFSIGGIKH